MPSSFRLALHLAYLAELGYNKMYDVTELPPGRSERMSDRMHVFHPPQSVNGLPPENTFYVADSANMTVADGFLIQTHHPYLFPERPINLFLSIRSKGPGRDMLMGARLARAQQLREQTPMLKARVFAQVSPQDTPMMAFYLESGFDANDALDVVQLGVPNARPAAPMGYDMGFVPMSNPGEIQAFLMRMNAYGCSLAFIPLAVK